MLNERFKIILQMSMLTVVVGLLSGILGAVITENYLAGYAASLEDHLDRSLELSEQKPRPLPGTYEEAVATARKTVEPALARFYKGTLEAYLPGAASSLGVVVTSDGWILTRFETIEGDVPLHVFVGDQAYPVLESVSDPLTKTAMVRVAASGLPVVAFGASSAVEGGDLAFAAVSEEGILPTAVVDAHHWIAKTAASPAEQFSSDFLLADTFPKMGTPVVNTLGELIALDSTPLHQILPALKTVIRSGESSRPTLGATVMDLGAAHISESAISASLARGYERGVYVSGVTIGGPAAEAGLRKGDIILKAGESPLTATTSIAELLTTYNPGDPLRLTIDRAGEEMEIRVELGE